MDWLKGRAKEPSTWRGLGLLLVAVGLIPAGSVELIVSAGVAIAGLADVLKKEN